MNRVLCLRRVLARTARLVLVAAVAFLIPWLASAEPASRDLVRLENEKPGAPDWQLTYVRIDKGEAGFRSSGIEGYCSRQSVAAGEPIEFFVSAEPECQFTIEIFRMGYYGGKGARLMQTLGPLAGKPQAVPPAGARRIRECRWEPSARLVIPADWPSGVYLGRLSRVPNPDGTMPWQSYVVFIVRDDRPADILFQCPDNTWQAYNRWPDSYSLYIDPENERASCNNTVDVSFDRPYGKYVQIYQNPQSVGSGEFLCFEFPLCYWLEQHGYDVSYCSNSDMLTPDRAAKCKAFISVGHDEYWDVRQYESVRKIAQSGVCVLFLSGNAVCWVSPFRDGFDGRHNRIISRKAPYQGLTMGPKPLTPEFVKATYEFVGPDEGLLVGARNILPVNGGGDWVCAKPEHWIFAGTGMKKGDRIRGLVGWEFHGEPAPIPGLEVVAEGIALHGGTEPVPYQATIYPTVNGGFVFNASTIFWSFGLSSPPGHMPVWSHNTRPHGPDERVQQITHNLLRRAIDR
ncbi:MAG: N,N-dimethylformamidase beta subunit family domain-containing protein [Thermoguttaceae bacterium]|jgi:hypothetical protein